MEPRYQCVALGPVWSWRLLGSNHRELARAARRFATVEEATADALAVSAQAGGAPIEIAIGPNSTWQWVMTVDGARRATSAVGYARRLECARAVDRFRRNAPAALVSSTPLVHRRLGDRGHPPGTDWWRDDPAQRPSRTSRPR